MLERLPNPIINIPKKIANYLLDLVLGAEEEFQFKGDTTPASITIIESEPEDIVA